MMSLVDISIRRAVFAVMLIASLVGLGFMSMGRLGVDLFPDVEFPYVNVTATLDGASAETMESEVTDILEEYINTIDGIETLQSFSSEGRAQILIEFNLSSNAREKVQDVRDKVQVALAELPPDMDPPIVDKVDPDAAPIISVMIAGDLPIAELTAFADDVAKERLQRLDGVGAVKLVGGRERAVRIWLDNERLRAFGVTADDVRRAIQSEHAELPGGRLETAARTLEFGVKTVAEVTRANGFSDLPVAYRENGVTIRISDVARVEDGLEDERSAAFLNGRRGISLDIRKQSGQNTVEVAHQVKDAAVIDFVPSADGFLTQRLGDVALAHSWRADEQDVPGLGDELAGGQFVNLGPGHTGVEAEVEVAQAALLAEGGGFGVSGNGFAVATVDLVLEQQLQELGVRELMTGGFLESQLKVGCQGAEAQFACLGLQGVDVVHERVGVG